ncbi:MAG: class I SAM-dependent methyltransferase [Verrucomicrobiota bacterium]
MSPPRPTELAHLILRGIIREGDLLIDATTGNGHDTVFLAEIAGESGRVLAFDIQDHAIQSARSRVETAGFSDRVDFHLKSHAKMADYAEPGTVAAVMFNLGYLPGEDHQLTTEEYETLAALTTATTLLKPGGILSVVCYPGHDAGMIESAAVESWASTRTAEGWRVAKYAMLGTLRPAPFLILLSKP